jgi:hypothetical protein
VDFTAAVLHVRRVKKRTPAEMRALRKLQRESTPSSFVFVSERGAPFSTAGFAKMIERAGVEAKLDFNVGECRPRLLRLAGLSRPPEHPAHGALYRAGAGPVQGLLAGLSADVR